MISTIELIPLEDVNASKKASKATSWCAGPLTLDVGDEVVIGRENAALLFQKEFNDKKCSRQQVQIVCKSPKEVIIRRLGTNPPCIIRDGSSSDSMISLDKNTDYQLKRNDKFCLVVGQYPFLVSMDDGKKIDEPKNIKPVQNNAFVDDDHVMDNFKSNSNNAKRKIEDEKPDFDYLDEFNGEENVDFSTKKQKTNQPAFTEISGDLFQSVDSLANCISEDCNMSSGIIKTFKDKFGGPELLLSQNPKTGGCVFIKDSKNNRYAYYLITKAKYWEKPSYNTLKQSLQSLLNLCQKHNVTRVSMPRIGCGLDKLEWSKVKPLIQETFVDTGISITIYNYAPPKNQNQNQGNYQNVNKFNQFANKPGKEPQQHDEDQENDNTNTADSPDPKYAVDADSIVQTMKWTVHKDTLYVYHSNQVKPSKKIIGFDLDGTIVEPKSGGKFPKDSRDWRFLFDCIPKIMKQKYQEGYKLVIFTNQAGISKGKQKPEDLKQKIDHIIKHEFGVPVQVFMACGEDLFRKPSTTTWDYFVENFNQGVKPDKKQSMYVGDAAGRPLGWKPGKSKDFACSDRAFAFNIGIVFKTPEEFFLDEDSAKFFWDSIDPKEILEKAADKPFKLNLPKTQELLVCVGCPASGKSTFAKHFLEPKGYVRVNQDTLKNKERCVKASKEAISEGKSVVIDNTNPSVEVRALYIQIAKAHHIPCRCLVFTTEPKLAAHMNAFREKITKGQVKVPKIAYNVFKSKFKEPTVAEGFKEIIHVPFVPLFESEKDKQLFLQRTSPPK